MKGILFAATALSAGIMANLAFADNDFSEKRDHKGFTVIKIETGLSLDVHIGDEFSVEVMGDEKKVARLKTRVENNALVIDYDKDKIDMGNSLHMDVTLPKFTRLQVDGAVDADIEDFDGGDFEIELNGAGNIEMEGTCDKLDIELNGAGNIEAEDLECKDVEVDVNGAGNVEVYASESIDAQVSGFGNIDVYGKPKNVKTSDGLFSSIDIH
ncbi:head GIN domain-containing protein [Emcibacter sp.]|uniref:head GIN domain-containing protein n=1 Tax=Emcibacter sp. TaxID=1979954 RepID=UPI002AA66340|nr:head GIN domain-containing protein [Emcibacter sp.]